MSMLKYSLYELIATVPSCLETDTVAKILKLQSGQSNRIIVLNEQQHLTGVLYWADVVPHLLTGISRKHLKIDNGYDQSEFFDSQQPISGLTPSVIKPIKTVPVDTSWENLCLFLEQEYISQGIHLDFAFVDGNGKFLGVLDRWELLRKLETQCQRFSSKAVQAKLNFRQTQSKSIAQHSSAVSVENLLSADASKKKEYQSLIQLLERLPWPLMLQTSSGEVITQNPAWWQQLGKLKDPEGVRREVEGILSYSEKKKVEIETGIEVEPEAETEYLAQTAAPSVVYEQETENYFNNEISANVHTYSEETSLFGSSESRVKQKDLNLRDGSSSDSAVEKVEKNDIDRDNSEHRCFFDTSTGTCTCIVQVQDERERERVWKFAKIPLDDPELKISGTQSLQIDPNDLDRSHSFQSFQDSEVNSELCLILATDVTEQQQLSQELAAKNADLIQLNRLKDEFLACISHELKTPLTAVLGLSRLLIDQQLGKLNERQARYAGLIHQSGRHLMSVVNDILDLTRMETGQMDLTLTTVKIHTVCERAINEAKTIHERSNQTTSYPQSEGLPSQHELNLFIEPDLDEIIADELRLRQMLLHLLSNALKFTDTGGEIGLSVSRWEGWIAFNVWDTGIGIPEHQQHLIFQKFQQLENPMTRQFEGTGLGLVLTRALARLHGGDVSFLSNEGEGSNFTLLLPPCPPNTNVSESETGFWHSTEQKSSHRSIATSPNQLTSSQRLILVVEPIARYIEDLTKHLRSLGYRVMVARAGCEAIEKARRLQPQAIFLNPFLPLLSGWDVLTLIKSDGETRHIPVIITATAADKNQAYAKQADAFLSLPVQRHLLAPLLDKFCTIPEEAPRSSKGLCEPSSSNTPLRILRLVNSEVISTNSRPSLSDHRVIEVDDLDQAELLARVWKFDVVLLDAEVSHPQSYLEKLATKKRLASIPLVTCNITNTQAASGISALSVFPCLISPNSQQKNRSQTDALLSVLQIAAGVCCVPSILVFELATLFNSSTLESKEDKDNKSVKETSKNTSKRNLQNTKLQNTKLQNTKEIQHNSNLSFGSEWFQALIQYLQTAGFKAEISFTWSEVAQQILHKSVDLLLIYVGENTKPNELSLVSQELENLDFDLPPIIVLDRRVSSVKSGRNKKTSRQQNHLDSQESGTSKRPLGAIATEILPHSISMEDLLNRIYQALDY